MNYQITMEQFEQLIRIYNTFGTISTKGDDTITMGNCLQAFKTSIEEIAQQRIVEERAEEIGVEEKE